MTKYHAKPTVYNGVRYSSKGEAQCAAWLDMQVQAGELYTVLRQVPIQLGADTVWRCDFMCFSDHLQHLGGGRDVIQCFDIELCEFKGSDRQRGWPQTKKLIRKYTPFNVRVMESRGGQIVTREILEREA